MVEAGAEVKRLSRIEEIEKDKYIGGPSTVYLDEEAFDWLVERVKYLSAALQSIDCDYCIVTSQGKELNREHSMVCRKCKLMESE